MPLETISSPNPLTPIADGCRFVNSNCPPVSRAVPLVFVSAPTSIPLSATATLLPFRTTTPFTTRPPFVFACMARAESVSCKSPPAEIMNESRIDKGVFVPASDKPRVFVTPSGADRNRLLIVMVSGRVPEV